MAQGRSKERSPEGPPLETEAQASGAPTTMCKRGQQWGTCFYGLPWKLLSPPPQPCKRNPELSLVWGFKLEVIKAFSTRRFPAQWPSLLTSWSKA